MELTVSHHRALGAVLLRIRERTGASGEPSVWRGGRARDSGGRGGEGGRLGRCSARLRGAGGRPPEGRYLTSGRAHGEAKVERIFPVRRQAEA
ncbi:hypothetical protein GCM10009665_56500 [Kitasatospora nipponensis]|uniref:Uncharacterized protein n=1 Tax=Kitasatospora nipponensis TaxID=258049 RepID=A0ABN1WQA9_9ACTN